MKRYLLAVLALAALAVASTRVLWPQRDRVTQENIDRIQAGMSRAEVEAILGPLGDHRTGPTKRRRLEILTRGYEWPPGVTPISNRTSREQWAGDRGDCWVDFGPSGVIHTAFEPVDRIQQSPLENLLWRVRRQWKRWFP